MLNWLAVSLALLAFSGRRINVRLVEFDLYVFLRLVAGACQFWQESEASSLRHPLQHVVDQFQRVTSSFFGGAPDEPEGPVRSLELPARSVSPLTLARRHATASSARAKGLLEGRR